MCLEFKHRLLHTLGGQLSVLSGVMLFLFAVTVAFVWLFQGSEMLTAVAAMAGVCYVPTVLALLGEKGFAMRNPLFGMGWSMMLRSGVPLIAAMMLKLQGGSFAESSVLYYLMIFYLGSLITHVVFSYSTSNDSEPITLSNRPTE